MVTMFGFLIISLTEKNNTRDINILE